MVEEKRTRPTRRGRKARVLRRVVQALFLLLFYLLLVLTVEPYRSPVPTHLFLSLSPLNALSTLLSSRALYAAIWVAAIPVVLTLFLGRFFCGWVCPFGTTIDIGDLFTRPFRRRVKRGQDRQDQRDYPENPVHPVKNPALARGRRLRGKHGKYIILIMLLVFAVFQLNLSGWFDPISLATRVYGLTLHPYAYFIVGHGFSAVGSLNPRGPIDNALQNVQRYVFHPTAPVGSFYQPYFYQHVLIALLFLLIIGLGLVRRRFYCRNLCPLGAMLAFLSRFSLIRRRVNDNCTECELCLRGCRMGAISGKGKANVLGECIECMDCEVICPQKAIGFTPQKQIPDSPKQCTVIERVDFTRRALLGSVLGGVAAVPLFKLNLFTERHRMRDMKGPGEPTSLTIRPPGTLGIDEARNRGTTDEAYFLKKCIRCGECMKVCPTNGIQPLLFQDGIQGLWTPTLVPRIRDCEYDCTLCMEVCPTGALSQLAKTKAEQIDLKHKFVIGRARFNRNKCIPWRAFDLWTPDTEWSDDFNCKVCEEHCPARDDKNERKAIIILPYPVETKFGPRSIDRLAVVDDICIGCAICEKVCPVEGEAAIRVWRTEQRGFTSVRGGIRKA